MKNLTETKIYKLLLLGFLMILASAAVFSQAHQQQITRKINAYQPLVVTDAYSKYEAYETSEVIVGVFTGERFTTAPSVMNRQLRCSNGFRLREEFPVAGRQIEPFVKRELQLLRIPEDAGGICNFRFSEQFNEIIEGREVSKTAVYEFDFEVLQ